MLLVDNYKDMRQQAALQKRVLLNYLNSVEVFNVLILLHCGIKSKLHVSIK